MLDFMTERSPDDARRQQSVALKTLSQTRRRLHPRSARRAASCKSPVSCRRSPPPFPASNPAICCSAKSTKLTSYSNFVEGLFRQAEARPVVPLGQFAAAALAALGIIGGG